MVQRSAHIDVCASMKRASFSAERRELVELPDLVEPLLEWTVEPEQMEPCLAWDGSTVLIVYPGTASTAASPFAKVKPAPTGLSLALRAINHLAVLTFDATSCEAYVHARLQ